MESVWVVTYTDDWSVAGDIVAIIATELGALQYCHWRAHNVRRKAGLSEIDFGETKRDRVVQGERPMPASTRQTCRYVSVGDDCWFVHDTSVLHVPKIGTPARIK